MKQLPYVSLCTGEGRWGTDESTFISVMTTRSFPHLRYVFEHYENTSGTPFEEAIRREFRGNTEDAMLVIGELARPARRKTLVTDELANFLTE